jgi:hypothetical protein
MDKKIKVEQGKRRVLSSLLDRLWALNLVQNARDLGWGNLDDFAREKGRVLVDSDCVIVNETRKRQNTRI